MTLRGQNSRYSTLCLEGVERFHHLMRAQVLLRLSPSFLRRPAFSVLISFVSFPNHFILLFYFFSSPAGQGSSLLPTFQRRHRHPLSNALSFFQSRSLSTLAIFLTSISSSLDFLGSGHYTRSWRRTANLQKSPQDQQIQRRLFWFWRKWSLPTRTSRYGWRQ